MATIDPEATCAPSRKSATVVTPNSAEYVTLVQPDPSDTDTVLVDDAAVVDGAAVVVGCAVERVVGTTTGASIVDTVTTVPSTGEDGATDALDSGTEVDDAVVKGVVTADELDVAAAPSSPDRVSTTATAAPARATSPTVTGTSVDR